MTNFEDYQKEKLTINLIWANVFGVLITIPIFLLFGIPYFLVWAYQFHPDNLRAIISNITPNFIFVQTIIAFVLFLVGIVLHELIHGITWSRFAEKGFESIKFGVLWKMITPYCHCKEPLKVSQYILGAIMPSIILGVIPGIVAILIGNFGLLIFAVFFTMAGAGDFLIINLLKKENKDDLVLDHPSEAGCYIYRKGK